VGEGPEVGVERCVDEDKLANLISAVGERGDCDQAAPTSASVVGSFLLWRVVTSIDEFYGL
jgi:hypothetical protein